MSLQADELLLQVRMLFWVQVFMQVPDSKFAKAVAGREIPSPPPHVVN